MPTVDSSQEPRTFKYGLLEAQEGDLYLPLASRPPVVCLLHGGFWRMPYDRGELADIANDIAAKGYAVWNIEYRRVGAPGGGWPGTLSDVALAVDHLGTLADRGFDLDLDRVIVVGHSAGGHLALWVSARSRSALFRTSRIQPIAAAGLAAVTDLARTYEISAGNGAVNAFLGSGPDQVPELYAAASPIELLPLGIEQLIIHGSQDQVLPIDLSRSYAAAAQASGDRVDFVELPRAGHMDFLDPHSEAHTALCRWLAHVSARRDSTASPPGNSLEPKPLGGSA
jgi:acetyl esterase/lipase